MEPIYRYDIVQGTDEWHQIRLGRFTGSTFYKFIKATKEKKEELIASKAVEHYLGDTDDSGFTTFAMERGSILEPEARRLYQAINDVTVKEVGFVEYGEYAGCSPDGLVGDDGFIEIKCPLAHNFLVWRKNKLIKPEYVIQIQYNLYITKRQWCDFFVYHPRLGYYCIRVEKDPKLQEIIEQSLKELQEQIEEYKTECLS